MIMPLEEVWNYANAIPGWFTRSSVEELYGFALTCEGTMVEVGVNQGRSASVLLLAARHTGSRVILIDSWESVLIENLEKVRSRFAVDFPDVPWRIINLPSVEAAELVDGPLSLVHIDANHYDEHPSDDCAAWLPKLSSGGIACFHDYGSTFEAVTPAVDKHTAGWGDLGVWDGLAIRRKQ